MAKKKVKKKSNAGRPVKINAEITNNILAALQVGAYIETAVAYAGISKDTFYNWLKRGRRAKENAMNIDSGIINMRKLPAADRPFVEFSDAIEKALADAELLCLKQIQAAMQEGHWQAAAWRLERKDPRKWGRKLQASAGIAIGEGQLENGQNQADAKHEGENTGNNKVLDHKNPPTLYLTLDIGGKEIDPSEID